jgi:hypothetical protein
MSSKSFQNASKLRNIVNAGEDAVSANPLGFYFVPSISNSIQVGILGTSSSQISNAGTSGVFAKYSSVGAIGSSQNPACYAVGYKYSTAAESRVQGFYGEAIDITGGVGSFVEGARFAGINVTSGLQGDVYGIICVAQSGDSSNVPNSNFVIGCESEVIKFGSDSPNPNLFNIGQFSANYLATNRVGKRADAAFLCNPYSASTVAPQVGFMVGPGQNDISGASKSVQHTGFGCYQTGLIYGIDLSRGSYSFAAISIPNNTPIRAKNGAGNNENNILYLDASDICHVAQDASFVSLDAPLGLTDQTTFLTAGAIAGYISVYINGTQQKIAYYNL